MIVELLVVTVIVLAVIIFFLASRKESPKIITTSPSHQVTPVVPVIQEPEPEPAVPQPPRSSLSSNSEQVMSLYGDKPVPSVPPAEKFRGPLNDYPYDALDFVTSVDRPALLGPDGYEKVGVLTRKEKGTKDSVLDLFARPQLTEDYYDYYVEDRDGFSIPLRNISLIEDGDLVPRIPGKGSGWIAHIYSSSSLVLLP